ncbi:MAG: hypothetical protein MI807_21035 [Verrucomicrobiales bacterium]|nr:hypothetical protein [Verrucomicrobiales bacterium]
MKSSRIPAALTIIFLFVSSAAFGVDIQGDYVLVTAMPIEGEVDPHTLNAKAARITKKGEVFEITIDDIVGAEPVTVSLHIDGSKISFFLPPREFDRDGKSLMSNARAYFGKMVADFYIAGASTYGGPMESLKLKRVEPIP